MAVNNAKKGLLLVIGSASIIAQINKAPKIIIKSERKIIVEQTN